MANPLARHPVPLLAHQEPAGYLANPSSGHTRVPNENFDPGHPLHPVRRGKAACDGFALLDLRSMAAWEDGAERSAGEVLAGTRWLSDRWRWPRTRVRRFLEELEATGTISWMRGTKKGEPSRIMIVGHSRMGRRNPGPVTLPNPRPQSTALTPPNNGAAFLVPPAPISGTNPRPGNATPTYPSATAGHQRVTGKVEGPEVDSLDDWLSQKWPTLDDKKKQETGEAVGFGASPRLSPGRPEDDDASTSRVREEQEKKSAAPAVVGSPGNYCRGCGTTVGPTTDLCARCKYGRGRA